MIRITIPIASALAVLTLVPLARPAAAQQGPALKAEATITGEIVRIGDLIENAGVVADVAIFRAPDLGQTGGVAVSRVIDAVRPHHIIGLDTRGLSEVVVTRASRTIARTEIEAKIKSALANQRGLTEGTELAVTFDNDVRTLAVDPGDADLRVARLNFDPRTGRFDVSFALIGGNAGRVPLRFTGTLMETFAAVVLNRQMEKGEVIKASDVTATRRPKAEVAAGVMLDPADAIGLAARRPLRVGQVIRSADLVKPEVVARNESVTITYRVPGIVLSVRGHATEGGAMGDTINVVNVQTKKSFQAVIIGPGRVSVTATSTRSASAERADTKLAQRQPD